MDKTKKQNVWFLIGLLLVGLLLFWRCFYGVNTTDEAYYIGTVYRLWFGDGMLCDEWNPTQQMCSFWLYPFYVIFRMILGSNDGMILAFRLLYIVFQLGISCYLYTKLKKYGYKSFFAVFFYLLSTAFNINSLSYNTMANGAFLALLVTLITMEEPDWKNTIIAGLFASILVMANPYTLFAYGLYGAASLIVTVICRKSEKEVPVSIRFATFLKMSLTAAVVMAVFLTFTFWHATLERIMKNLPYIIGDQEHVHRLSDKFSSYFRYFRKYYLGCTVGSLIVAAVALVDKKRIDHGKVYVMAALLFIFPYMIYRGLISDYVPINLVTIPISFLGLVAYIVTKEKNSRVFYIWYLPAMFYPVIVQITSNTGPLAVSAGFMTAGAASLFLAILWAEEQKLKSSKAVVYGVLIFQIIIMLYLRTSYVWGDDVLSKLTVKVDRGPAKGLYTTEETALYYEEMYDDIDMLNIKEEDGFLVIGSEPMLYLYADVQVASYSTWQVFTNETRLYRYYEIHEGEERFPSVVYCAEADETIFESVFVKKLLLPMGYEYRQLDHGIAFYTPR